MLRLFHRRHSGSFPLATEKAGKQDVGGLRMNYRINIDLATEENGASPG